MSDDIIDHLLELQIGHPSLLSHIANEIEHDSVQISLQIRNEGFIMEEFLLAIGIPLRCVESLSQTLNEHGYLHPESIASLHRTVLNDLDIKIGLRIKLLRGVALLRHLGYHSQPSG
jgi:hypothetical protein